MAGADEVDTDKSDGAWGALGFRSSPWVRYGCAVVSVGLALFLNKVLLAINPAISPVFSAAIMISAWFGGLGPGLVATGLAAFVSAYFFMQPAQSLDIGADDFIQLTVFAAEAVLISSLQEASRRSTARMQQAKEAAEAANQAKDRFLSVLSHELRMPLNPVLAAASAYARDGTLAETLREDMQMIRRNVELEARLIDDLLDLSRLGKGKLHLQREVLDVHALLREAYCTCEAEVGKKNIQVRWELEAEEHHVKGDAARVQQIFWNLIRNAVKFTPAGGEIFIRSSGDGEGRMKVEVRDTGIGIEEGALGRIFEAFEQGRAEIGQRFGGLGLGLAISRALVDLHGGEIRAESGGAGQGAAFTVWLPIVSAPVDVAEGSPVHAAELHRALRILLVEDHEDTLRLMSRLLEGVHHSVTAAASMRSAMAAAEEEAGSFDVVVSDLGLPDGSGFELMRQLREQYKLKGIALSGYGTEADVRRSREAGFVRHLVKPVDFARLEEAVREVGGGRNRNDEIRRPNVESMTKSE